MKRIFGINRGSIYASLCGYNILAAAVYYFIIIIIYPPFNFLNSNIIIKNSKIPACHSSVNSIKVQQKVVSYSPIFFVHSFKRVCIIIICFIWMSKAEGAAETNCAPCSSRYFIYKEYIHYDWKRGLSLVMHIMQKTQDSHM